MLFAAVRVSMLDLLTWLVRSVKKQKNLEFSKRQAAQVIMLTKNTGIRILRFNWASKKSCMTILAILLD